MNEENGVSQNTEEASTSVYLGSHRRPVCSIVIPIGNSEELSACGDPQFLNGACVERTGTLEGLLLFYFFSGVLLTSTILPTRVPPNPFQSLNTR